MPTPENDLEFEQVYDQLPKSPRETSDTDMHRAVIELQKIVTAQHTAIINLRERIAVLETPGP